MGDCSKKGFEDMVVKDGSGPVRFAGSNAALVEAAVAEQGEDGRSVVGSGAKVLKTIVTLREPTPLREEDKPKDENGNVRPDWEDVRAEVVVEVKFVLLDGQTKTLQVFRVPVSGPSSSDGKSNIIDTTAHTVETLVGRLLGVLAADSRVVKIG